MTDANNNKLNINKYLTSTNSPFGQDTISKKQIPWEFGVNQKIQGKQIRLSKINIKAPFKLSRIGSATATIGTGSTLVFQTSLAPQTPHANEMIFGIPHIAIYANTYGVGSLQIWPSIGQAISYGAFTVTAWYDWHAFVTQTQGSVIPVVSGQITNNTVDVGTLVFAEQWQSIDFNTGSVILQ